ncbi:MAG: prepilin-type N-terminal cleavage/methylation domain-containing protein [Thermoguttaceae bacterium]|jgi:prepilin-type N-terminal cleavage/methylation domain-containing protein/prepilin-type processing-associated H-X9-DG protein
MEAIAKHNLRDNRRLVPQAAFTLVEMMVVISIISLLVAVLLPALNLARESGRQTTCKSNLHQFGVGLQHYAGRFGSYCSGAFDWQRDGAVTEVGWVADLLRDGMAVGKMLCPSSSAKISAAYNDLLTLDTSTFDSCLSRTGSLPRLQPDGTSIYNPCALIAGVGGPVLPPNSTDRQNCVVNNIYNKHYNTNYTASWWLVRSGVLLDANYNYVPPACGNITSLALRSSTFGPLGRSLGDVASCSNSFLPLMGCGGLGPPLAMAVGPVAAGAPTALSFTPGPVDASSMQMPQPPSTDPGTNWSYWHNGTLQDFRAFLPVHRGSCNILFADGSVSSFNDTNGDGLLNNGFKPSTAPNSGFSDATVELLPDEFYSKWSLRDTGN